jgi:hypothetical protein
MLRFPRVIFKDIILILKAKNIKASFYENCFSDIQNFVKTHENNVFAPNGS